MKPEINLALINAAQEIIGRFSPLIEDEYERSRLGSWGALVLISAMKFNDAASSLEKENEDIIHWLNPDRDYLKKITTPVISMNKASAIVHFWRIFIQVSYTRLKNGFHAYRIFIDDFNPFI